MGSWIVFKQVCYTYFQETVSFIWSVDVKISFYYHKVIFIYLSVCQALRWLKETLVKLSQGLWTTTLKKFYHPNQLSTRCVIESFNSWLLYLSVSSSRHAGLTSLLTDLFTMLDLLQQDIEMHFGLLEIHLKLREVNFCAVNKWTFSAIAKLQSFLFVK